MDKLKWAAFGLALGIIGGGIGNAAADKWLPGVTRFDTIEARQIEIVNGRGVVVVRLRSALHEIDLSDQKPTPGVWSGNGVLEIVDAYGKIAAHLTTGKSGGGLIIYNKAGSQVAALGAAESGGGHLQVFNVAGQKVAGLYGKPSGYGGVLEVYRIGEHKVASLAVTNDGGGALSIFNAGGKTVATLP